MFGFIKRWLSSPKVYDTSRRTNRRLASLPSVGWEINTLIQTYGNTALVRSRHICLNNPYASKAKAEYVSALIGEGIKTMSNADNASERSVVQEVWDEFCDYADATDILNYAGLQMQIASELFEAGEVFVRFRPRLPQDGLTVPLQLQVIPAEMLPLWKNDTSAAGNQIRAGIELDPIGKRVAYHFLRYHPGVNSAPNPMPTGDFYSIVPAREVLHIYKPARAGQLRGIPAIVSSLTTFAMLDLYDDAELERKRTAALFAAFVTTPKDDGADHPLGAVLNTTSAGSLVRTSIGREFAVEPGAVITLEPGENIVFSEPADVGNNYELFQYRNLLRASVGTGVPYTALTGDLKQANYSSLRAGLVDFRRRISSEQKQIIIPKFCKPVWNKVMQTAAMAGVLPWSATQVANNTRTLLAAKHIVPAFEWVDPLNDIKAEVLAIDNHLKPRSTVIIEQGESPEEVDAQIGKDAKSLEAVLPKQALAVDNTNPQDSNNVAK